ncbi:Hypothetical_protein [Hexamita inflata]|uniref:Hypothetical_protein n=1 Tax=Hexamita inflata TaxID=28002 RepID=A0AA86PLF8_9EUKA|nr:Hypothetical protein HINF_LOCUS29181 [Hexamita inflata]
MIGTIMYILTATVEKQAIQCNYMYSRTQSVRYCDQQIYVVDVDIDYTTTSDVAFSFFLHTEVAKNLKIRADITAPAFSTFSMTGNLVVENCVIKVKATSTSSALLSLATRDVLVVDSVLKANFISTDVSGYLNSAGLSINASSINVARVNLTVDINTGTGDVSGVVSYCQSTILQKLQAVFTMYTISSTSSNSGAISAIAQNAVITISNSTLSGNMYAAADNGYLVGAGINVTIDVSDDSLITITGPQTNNTAHFWSCYGFCERPLPITTVLPVSAVTQIGSSSSCVFTPGTAADNSEVVFDQSRDFSFQGNFSVFGQTASVSNLKVSGRYQVTGELGSYANVFGSNMTDVLVLRKIIIQVSISTLSQCKLNLVTNQISAQFTINSFLANGSFQTEFQTFNAISVAAAASYTADQASAIINYQITGEVTTSSALSTLGVQVVKFIDLSVKNSFFTIGINFITTNGLVVGKANQDLSAPYEGKFIYANILVKQQALIVENMPSGVLFNLILGKNITIVNITIRYYSKNAQQVDSHSIFGNVFAPAIQITRCYVTQNVIASSAQRLGLVTFNYQSATTYLSTQINTLIYVLTTNLDLDSKNIGMLGVSVYTSNYAAFSAILNDCSVKTQIQSPYAQYVGSIVGCAYILVQVQSSVILDSNISASQFVGIVCGVVRAANMFKSSIKAFTVSGQQLALIQSVVKQLTISGSQFTALTLNPLSASNSALILGQISNGTIGIINLIFNAQINFETVFNVLFGASRNTVSTVQKSKINIFGAKNLVLVGEFTGGSVKFLSFDIQMVSCFSLVGGVCPAQWVYTGQDATFT